MSGKQLPRLRSMKQPFIFSALLMLGSYYFETFCGLEILVESESSLNQKFCKRKLKFFQRVPEMFGACHFSENSCLKYLFCCKIGP